MRQLIFFLFFLLGSCFQASVLYAGSHSESDTLVTVDDAHFSANDFLQWWRIWKEEGMTFPQSIDPYIDWLLLSREGRLMELDRDPNFRRKSLVYLKARTLLLLKNEEITNKIAVTEEELRKVYEEEYLPRIQTVVCYFSDRNHAEQAIKIVEESKVHQLEKLRALLVDVELVHSGSKEYRPNNIPEPWQNLFVHIEAGQTLPVISMGRGYMFALAFEKSNSSSEDYHNLRGTIEDRLSRQQERALNRRFMQTLMKKYQVVVHEDLLKSLDLAQPQEELFKKTLISTTQGSVTVEDFLQKLTKSRRVRKPDLSDPAVQEKEKWRVIRGIINQSLTSWEALSRHYEQRPPFLYSYRFNTNNRLVHWVEKRLYDTIAAAREEEIHDFYTKNRERWQTKALYSYIVVEGEPSLVKMAWVQGLTTGDLEKEADRLGLSVLRQSHVVEEAVPEYLAPVLLKLSTSEFSPLQHTNEKTFVVQLIAKKPGVTLEYENVKASVAKAYAHHKKEDAKKNLLSRLREQSVISVDKDTWGWLVKQQEI